MRKLFLLACFLGPLVAPATAQKRSVVAGLGVGFDLGDSPYEVLFGFSGTNTARLLVPIMVSRRIRLQLCHHRRPQRGHRASATGSVSGC
ncbi:MAG: hypothetical protein V3T16_06610 [Gemmatimonadales bacterium]